MKKKSPTADLFFFDKFKNYPDKNLTKTGSIKKCSGFRILFYQMKIKLFYYYSGISTKSKKGIIGMYATKEFTLFKFYDFSIQRRHSKNI